MAGQITDRTPWGVDRLGKGWNPSYLSYAKNPWTGLPDYTQILYKGKPVTMEELSRPFKAADTAPTKTIEVVRPTAPDLGDASLSWGKASRWSILDTSTEDDATQAQEEDYAGFTVTSSNTGDNKTDEPNDPPDQGPQVFQYNEVARAYKIVKVENPDDAEQYVKVEVMTQVLFRGPDGNFYQFNFSD